MVLEAFSYENTRNLPRLKMTEFCVSGTDVLAVSLTVSLVSGPRESIPGNSRIVKNKLITHAQLSA